MEEWWSSGYLRPVCTSFRIRSDVIATGEILNETSYPYIDLEHGGSINGIIEGLNLRQVKPGKYDLICLPVKIRNGDGAPARAILRRK